MKMRSQNRREIFNPGLTAGGEILDPRALLSCASLYAAKGFEGSGDEIGVVTH